VVAHWGRLEDLDDLLTAGIDGLEHLDSRDLLDSWPEEILAEIVARGLPLSPTLAVSEAAFAARDPTILARFQQRTLEFHREGGRVTVGSDAAMPGVPFGGGVHRELEPLVEAGLTPRDALLAATSAAADALRSEEVGVIEPGRAADLLAVGGDPFEDIGAIGSIVAVWRDGRLVVDHRH
jgi:imidazolonepropionase-like amidohydrolase